MMPYDTDVCVYDTHDTNILATPLKLYATIIDFYDPHAIRYRHWIYCYDTHAVR